MLRALVFFFVFFPPVVLHENMLALLAFILMRDLLTRFHLGGHRVPSAEQRFGENATERRRIMGG